jgi:phosphoesterase RecJ-like protein
MPIDWAPFVEAVRRHQRFLLTTHVRPDGDGLGSMQALGAVLRSLGKETQLVIPSSLPPRYRFLDPQGRIEHFELPGDRWRQPEVIVVLDTGTWNQLDGFGPFVRSHAALKIVIDHHQTQDDLGAICLVDATAEATGRLVYEAITALGAPMPPDAANDLFVALAMDTGWFRHSNASARSFELAARLIQGGARPELLYEHLFEQSTLPRLKLTGLVLDRLQTVAEGRVAYSEIRLTDYQKTGATPQDTEELVNYARSLSGVEVGLLFMEQPRGGIKVSLRSRSVDVARLAERFGGGGHRLASGATLKTTLEEARQKMLDAVCAEVEKAA